MRVPSIVAAIGVITLAAALACGPKTATQATSGKQPAVEIDHCLLFHSTADLGDTIVVALFDDVDPAHAPEWRNQSERLVFQHLYEGIQFPPGCDNRLLAKARITESGPIVATLTLRADALFWDGTPVTSRDVAESLESARAFVAGIDSITTPDSRTVEIHVTERYLDWRALTSPTCAITKPSAGGWPMGTGPYRIVDDRNSDRDLTIRPAFDSKKPVIRFVDGRGIDPRDMLDPTFKPHIDFMVVEDPRIIEYAESRDQFHLMELPETKVYFLLSPSRILELARGVEVPTVPDSLTQAIARDALRNANARSIAMGSGTRWSDLSDCDLAPRGGAIGAVPTTRRVLYDASDFAARDVADRIVALATGDPVTSTDVAALCRAVPSLYSFGSRVVAIGVSTRDLTTSLATGADFAYVVSLPFGRPENCFLSRELLRLAPWLGAGSAPLRLKTIPLVTTGPYAIARKSGGGASFALSNAASGDIIIVGTRRTESP